MQEHPVPQNVTGYEFHLIGQMTLKQFLEVAAGILIAVIINTTNLPLFIKYPLMFISGVSGAALAFIPFEGRPLDRWFFAFIRAIYQPTMFFWKKSNPIPEVFDYTVVVTQKTTEIDYKPIRHSRVQDYISSLTPTVVTKSDEDKQADDILKLFETNLASTQKPVEQPGQIPQVTVTTQAPVTQNNQILVAKQTKEVSIPVTKPIGVVDKTGVEVVKTETATSTQVPVKTFTEVTTTPKPVSPPVTVHAVATDTSLPFPNKPATPNMIVGMVVTADKKIIENAIITIYRKSNRTPVRALKTNTLGQFGVITALENGEYVLSTEKAGNTFADVSLALNNTIVDPLFLQANS